MINLIKYYTCILLFLLIQGCTPAFDWRVIKNDDEWEAIFPKKPLQKKRSINLIVKNQSTKVDITRFFCKVKNITFIIETSNFLNSNENHSINSLKEKLFETMKNNFNIHNEKSVGEIKIFNGYIKNTIEEKKIDLKIATLYKILDKKVLRGVVLSDSTFFNEDHAIFFLKSIK